ncbi:MAG TPA: ribonucleoside-diphosphate reductase, adenosylcobalamin-dependent, partial [Porphyromonadaceae bacterium]|nr:ribonucleoside-diphosphate reductase, adenosylcobalamin-dependent [Porphyromonadaceae bacterium]
YADLGFKTVSTNPCGEIPLCPYDSCRLLAINLYSYVVNPFKKEAYFDFDLFAKHVRLAQRIMDDIIDLESEKINKILDKINSDPESEEV